MTEPCKTGHPEGLTDKQNVALMSLVSGGTDEQAAEAAGVTRQTVNGWRNNNQAFRIALTNARAAIWGSCQRGIQESCVEALSAINKAIKTGDVRVSQWLLDKIGIDDLAKSVFEEIKVYPTSVEAENEAEKAREASLTLSSRERTVNIRELAMAEANEKIQEIKDRPDYDCLDFTGEGRLQQKYFGDALIRLKKKAARK